jgi:hypothetical protein
MLLPEGEIRARSLAVATLEHDVRVCDLTVRRALRAGVTTLLTAGADYADANALADAVRGRHPAVRWRLRHDLRQKLVVIAWFGDTGPVGHATLASLPPTDSNDIPDDLAADACRIFGYTVLPDPPS